MKQIHIYPLLKLAGILTVLFLSCLFSGCQTTTIVFDTVKPAPLKLLPDNERRYASMALGIYELSKPETATCSDVPAKVVIRRNVVDALIHATIGGIYTTRSIEVYCGEETAPPAQAIQPGQPAQPVRTGQPAQPGRAGQPAQPARTGQPSQPARTGQPSQPARTGQPVKPR